MLWFERHVVDGLVTTDDARRRRDIVAYVDGSVRALPEHLRFAIGAASVLLGAVARLLRPDPARAVRVLDRSPIAPMRQYVRLFRSLVLFAENELP